MGHLVNPNLQLLQLVQVAAFLDYVYTSPFFNETWVIFTSSPPDVVQL